MEVLRLNHWTAREVPILLLKKKKLFIDFWLCWVSVAVQAFSLVAARWGYSPVAVSGLLLAVASPVTEPGL